TIVQAHPSARRVKVFSPCPTHGAGKREARMWIYRDPLRADVCLIEPHLDVDDGHSECETEPLPLDCGPVRHNQYEEHRHTSICSLIELLDWSGGRGSARICSSSSDRAIWATPAIQKDKERNTVM